MSLWGRERKGLLKGGRQCSVSRKDWTVSEGAKGIELERSPRGGWCLQVGVIGIGRQSLPSAFFLSKDHGKYFYINVLAVLLPTPILCRLLGGRPIVLSWK